MKKFAVDVRYIKPLETIEVFAETAEEAIEKAVDTMNMDYDEWEYADSISELPIEENDYKERLYGKAKLSWNGKTVERDCNFWLNAFRKDCTPENILRNETVNIWLYKHNQMRIPDKEICQAMYDAVEIIECRVEREVYEV